MRKILNNFILSAKKVTYYRGRSLFVVLPIALMITVFVFLASESQNLLLVANKSIFSSLRSQNEVIELSKNSGTDLRSLFSNSSASYSAADVDTIKSISNVENANLVKEVPIDTVYSTDIISDKKINLNSIVGISSEFAGLYTNESFNYSEGQAIPIILNANDFYEIVEDWQGQTEITVDASSFRPGQGEESESEAAASPIKTISLGYDREDLIGKEIEVAFGGLTDITTITQEQTSTGYKYTPKSAETIASETQARQDAISKYWNYDVISTPLTYKFKIVGIVEGVDKTRTYIPESFATKLMADYFSNQISARNSTAISATEYNVTYTGLVYDGTTLTADTSSTLAGQIRNQFNQQVQEQFNSVNEQITAQNQQINSANAQNNQNIRNASETRPNGPPPSLRLSTISNVQTLNASNIKISFNSNTTSYSIPGLAYSKDNSTQEITGLLTDTTKLTLDQVASSIILIKVNDINNREQVVTDLNSKGFRYTDNDQYKSIERLESYLSTAVLVVSIAVLLVTALFIFINMAKFVSEGKKEIGILRAMGATKGSIMFTFNVQALLYSLVAIITGGLAGIGLTLGLSSKATELSAQVINSILGSSIPLSANITAADFQSIAWEQIGIYAGIMLIVTLVTAFFPAWQASRVSPVEAIRNS